MENLGDLGFGDGFLDTKPKLQTIREKIGNLDFISIKKLCSAKDTVKNKANHNLRENICNTYLTKDWYLNYTENS